VEVGMRIGSSFLREREGQVQHLDVLTRGRSDAGWCLGHRWNPDDLVVPRREGAERSWA